jgi:ABC-2 type transport system ATP-binding protein
MPQDVVAMPGLRTREQAALAGWMQGMSRAEAWRASADALAAVDLSAQCDLRASELSGGQLRRLGVAEVLAGRPAAILLDEPTVGLDPAQRSDLLRLIGQLGERCQVIVATHLVEDLARSFDSVGILVAGSMRFTGSVSDLLEAGRETGDFGERASDAYRRVVEDVA